MKCQYCHSQCIKHGKRKEIQRYLCKGCGCTQQTDYRNKAWKVSTRELFQRLISFSLGIRDLSTILGISKDTVMIWIKEGGRLKSSPEFIIGDEYEMDEMKTYVGKKTNECWVIYAISRTSGKVMDLVVGKRTKENLQQVTDRLLSMFPKKIYTDRLPVYKGIIPSVIHHRGVRRTRASPKSLT